MRQRERADSMAGARENAAQQGDAGSLAVRPADRDDRTGWPPPVQTLERTFQSLEPHIDRAWVQRLLPGEPIGETREMKHRETPPSLALPPLRGGRAVRYWAGSFVNMRSSEPMRSRMSRRSTIMSSAPCSSRNSLRWNPSGSV